MRAHAFLGKYVLAGVAALAAFASLGTAHAGITVLYDFKGGSDGANPAAGLISDSGGNLYGTTYAGGIYCGCGTVFKLAPDGTETVLHAFANDNGDGAWPAAGLIQDKAGNLYGTTYQGPQTGEYEYGHGIVFKLAPDGTETVLYTFTGGRDGANPESGLIEDTAGNLYGTTEYGGHGKGIVFKLAPDGKETVLHSFTGKSDGAKPEAGLIRDKSGNLYGTTSLGGGTGCIKRQGCGTVFKIAPDGKERVLHTFAGGSDGATPESGLIQDKSGNLYGTTDHGGLNGCLDALGDGCGTVFKLAPDGTETVLYRFTDENGDGAKPAAGLIRDKAGNLYGTTPQGGDPHGDHAGGTVFKLAPDGTETVLYAFGQHPHDGRYPYAGLLKGADGELYGTASNGGAERHYCAANHGCGTVFRIKK